LAAIPFAEAAAALLASPLIDKARGSDASQALLSGGGLALPLLAREGARFSAMPAESGWRVVGKAVAPCAAAAWLLVEVALPGGEQALAFVANPGPGVSIKPFRAVDGALAGEVSIDCRLDSKAVATGAEAEAFVAGIARALDVLRAAELVGLADAAINRTLEHLRTRQQFGRPLGSFQALQFRAVDAYMGVALARALTGEAARLADRDGAEAADIASAARLKAADAAFAATKAMTQLHGAIGFTDEHDIGLYLKRAVALGAGGSPARRRAEIAARTLDGAREARFRQDSAEDAAFRAEVREWLASNLPERLRNLPTRPDHKDADWWHKKLFERGWVAPAWPREHGGMGASVARQLILFEEMGAIGAPEISGQAISHLGPILQAFGTPEQKARHLPGMLSGETTWCQGYSEPGAGSDLASLRTKAVRDGDDFVVNGSKIWTTWAHYADWMFALVRTNPEAKKQLGITFILVDMKSPGITRRPIQTLAGDDEFSEVFFDDVRVPAANVVGAVDDGWRVATALLEKERLNGANPRKCAQLFPMISRAAKASGVAEDAAFRDRLARAAVDYMALCAVYAQIAGATEARTKPTGDFAFAKLINAELSQSLCELLIEAFGPRGAAEGPIEVDGDLLWPGRTFLQSRRNTIHGGTVEIQRGLIARRVLGLG
jgi:alkylation response protein AidB-like acyl-CoA dehydrogenase